MDFHKLKFTKPEFPDANDEFLPKELRDLEYPWLYARIPRLIFKDCSVQLVLDEIYSYHFGVDKSKAPERTVTLTANIEVAGKLNEFHEGAYNHFIQNALSYEKRLLDFLFAKTQGNIAAAIAAKDSPELRAFIKKYSLDTQAGLTKQVTWEGLTIYDRGWDGIGFSTMDFSCGWDEEHGLSILMHRDKIIAEGGLADFSNCGDRLIDHAKSAQSYTTGYDVVLP